MLELDKSGFDQTDIDIISVDIFDTVLLRDYSCGQRHFLGIARQSAKQLKVAGYARAVQRYLLKVIENMDLRPPRAAA